MILTRSDASGWRWTLSGRAWLLLWMPVVLITASHYLTGAGHHWAHDVFRRLYYIPIVLGAFAFGVRGALVTSVAVSVLYFPHAFSHFFHQDPGRNIEKVLEILLYNVIGYITGTLADREHRERLRQEGTAKRLAESLEELRSMERQLVRAGKLQALGELTAGLAHEIKNPLASLKGATEIISDEIPETSPRRKMVEILAKELDRLTALLERFLSFARQPKFEVSDVKLADVLEPVLALMTPQARREGVEIVSHASSKELVVKGDKEHITLVLMNLILNAVQAMPAGGGVTIASGTEQRGRHQYCFLDIEDSGAGVPEELREQIFNPFFTTKENGSGLGLSIAARVIDAHDGFIEVTNGPQGGARFHVVIPAASPAAS